MSGTFLRLIPGVLTIAIGTVLAITQTGSAITTDLSARAESALDASTKSWANISVDGRTLVLSGTATEKSAIAAAVEASFFGARPLDAAAFADCRKAYERFAFPEAWA